MVNSIRKTSKIPSSCVERYLDLNNGGGQQLAQAGICFSGVSRLRKGYQIAYAESRNSHMIILTCGGEGYLTTGKKSFRLTADTLIVVPSGVPNGFGIKGDDWRIAWFYLTELDRWRNLEGPVVFRSTSLAGQMERAMEGYLAACQGGTEDLHSADVYAGLIVHYLERITGSEPEFVREDTGHCRLEKIWARVREQPELPWDAVKLAESLNMSYSTFKRLVMSQYQTTPWQMVIRIRMEQAKLLLRQSHYPIKLIASRVGYGDEYIFSSAFAKHVGHCPRDYRKGCGGAGVRDVCSS